MDGKLDLLASNLCENTKQYLRQYRSKFRENHAMHFTIREKTYVISLRHVALVFALILILTATGPFGTYSSFDLWKRLGYWGTAVATVGVCGHLIGWYCHHSPRFRALHPLLISLVSAAIATVPGTLIIFQIEMVWRQIDYSQVAVQEVATGVFVINLIATIIRFGTWRPEYQTRKTPPSLTEHVFFENLPKNLRSELISLTMRDHYIECVTGNGSKLLLMRFVDAMRQLSDYPGLQIHRSHWVAADTIVGIKREGSRYMATLTDGRKLPVSRTHLDAARKAIISKK